MTVPDPEAWRRLLAQLDEPRAGDVAEALAGARDLPVNEAYDAVEAALDGGVLAERDTGGAFPEITVAGAGDPTDAPAHNARESVAGPDGNGLGDTSETNNWDPNMTDGAGVGAGDDDVNTPTHTGKPANADRWQDVDFADPDPGIYPPAHLAREQWMGHVGKKPFAPWGNPDPDDADPDDSPRWEWGREENYVDGERIRMAEDDPRLDGRVFLQQESDPFAFVDGDDVRDPDTGEVHPAFVALLEHLGMTYADVSTSGAGVHAYYRGELPIDGKGQATFQLDTEPWGANDDPPSIEIYANKHVCVATGEHVPGTGTEVREWNTDALRAILEAAGYDDEPEISHDTDREREDLDDYDPDAVGADDTTDDVRDVLAAVDRLAPRDLPLRTSPVGEDSTGWEKWDPSSYRTSSGNDSLHKPPDEPVFHDFKHGESFGVLSLYAAEKGIITHPWDRLAGREWWEAVEAARDAGAPIPEYVGDTAEDTDPVAPIPLERLATLERDDARRFARKHGADWPTSREARERLEDTVKDALRHEDDRVIDAPTALGKTGLVATTRWGALDHLTGDQPVIQLHDTREARDQAAERSSEAGIRYARLRSRKEACVYAAGEHDPRAVAEADEDRQEITVGGTPVSEWFDRVCENRGVPFSVAHAYAAEHNDQGAELHPDGECPAQTQHEGLPRTDDGEPAVDVIHATHAFARVPSYRYNTNLIFDERPDFATDLEHGRVREAVTAFLEAAEAPYPDFERFVAEARADSQTPNEHAKKTLTTDALDYRPAREWFLEADGAHTLAPAIARAIYYALDDGADTNGRFSATVPYAPPRFDVDDEGDDRVFVTVVLDADNTVRTVRAVPDFSRARSVIGLDAHPALPLWQANTQPHISRKRVLDPEERRRWRVFERGLVIAQVGEADRPLASGEYFNPDKFQALASALRDRFGDAFRSAITASAVESEVHDILEDVGVPDPVTMHYGEEKSRNDFAELLIGLLEGAVDPGDDYVFDLLAELGLDAAPETVTVEGEEKRAHGRQFVGEDADTAEAILASVRENHVAQAAGRYGRDLDDDALGIVFVHTDATPPGFADLQLPDVEYATDDQAAILEALGEHGRATAREIADDVDASKRTVARTLRQLVEGDTVTVREGAGDHGADVYRALAGVDEHALGGLESDAVPPPEQIATTDVWGSYTWSVAIYSDSTPTTAGLSGSAGSQAPLGSFDTPPPAD